MGTFLMAKPQPRKKQSERYFGLLVFFFVKIAQLEWFHLPDISVHDIQNHEVQITWQVSNEAEEIQEYFVLYKPVAEKEIWSFKKTKTEEATLLPLQPGTDYMLRIVGYSASEQVYASGVVRFLTSAGEQIETFSNIFFLKIVLNCPMPVTKDKFCLVL